MSAHKARAGQCPNCAKVGLIMPLHGENGGPEMCLDCGMDWHARHTRRRKFGRIVVKAMKLYMENGGSYLDFNKLKLTAAGIDVLHHGADTIGTDVGDITSELLADILQLTHPDKHPPERREMAQRVTQQLLALKPFTFPAPKPKPAPVIAPREPERDGSAKPATESFNEALRKMGEFPCAACCDTIPYFYCDPCRAEWDRRCEAEREGQRKRARRQYRLRQERRRRLRGAKKCAAGCGAFLDHAARKDAKFCSAACRQRAHRLRMTAAPTAHGAVDEAVIAEAAP